MLNTFKDLKPGKLYSCDKSIAVIPVNHIQGIDAGQARVFPSGTLFMFVGRLIYRASKIEHNQILIKDELFWVGGAWNIGIVSQEC